MKRGIVSSLLILLVGCSDSTSTIFEPKESDVIRIELDTGLNSEYPLSQDANGYYHLELGNNWQTLHRISGTAYMNDIPLEVLPVEWESDLYWYLGDTLGYVVTQYLNNNAVYVAVDTSYMIGFNGLEVPTSNVLSYSNSYGQLSNMIAPVKSMIGDTLRLTARWYNGEETFDIVLD